jgi:hypothetical protein
MAARSTFIREHLEQVSATALSSHRAELEELLDGKPGIYALYRRDKLVYVGMAKRLFPRLRQHRRDRHKGTWDRFSAYVTRRESLAHEVETLALRVMQPTSNRKSGRFGRSTNLARQLEQLLAERHRNEKAMLLGGRSGRRHRRRAAKGLKGSEALRALTGRRRVIKGWCRGEEYRATLLKNGKIRADGVDYESPGRAATTVTGSSRRGWSFWHYKNKSGEWVPLRELK